MRRYRLRGYTANLLEFDLNGNAKGRTPPHCCDGAADHAALEMITSEFVGFAVADPFVNRS